MFVFMQIGLLVICITKLTIPYQTGFKLSTHQVVNIINSSFDKVGSVLIKTDALKMSYFLLTPGWKDTKLQRLVKVFYFGVCNQQCMAVKFVHECSGSLTVLENVSKKSTKEIGLKVNIRKKFIKQLIKYKYEIFGET